MTTEKSKPAGIQGLWDVSDLEGPSVPAPSATERQSLAKAGERLGFASREPTPPKVAPPKPEKEMTARITIRIRPADKQRVEDYAYRQRKMLGDVMADFLDLAEAREREAEQAKG